jgi:NAD(P)-dependent dehydrogenase (short-subunit alcohol dehydrogenase family)
MPQALLSLHAAPQRTCWHGSSASAATSVRLLKAPWDGTGERFPNRENASLIQLTGAYADMADTKKIALITGGNKGLGFETARQLGTNGFTVVLGVRNRAAADPPPDKLRGDGTDAQIVEIDLTKPETAVSAAAEIEAKFGVLDVLINNAGIVDAADGPPSKTSVAAVRRVFETNFLGTLAVTQAMLPLLKKSAAGRSVNVSSGLGSIAQNNDPGWEFAQVKVLGYNGSKAALNMLTVQLAAELRDTPIKVNSSDPGYTATDLNHNSGYQTVEEGVEATVRLALLDADGPTGGYFDRNGAVPW